MKSMFYLIAFAAMPFCALAQERQSITIAPGLDASRLGLPCTQAAGTACRRYLPITFTKVDGSTTIAKMPYWSNYPITQANATVNRVIIVMHGSGSNAAGVFNTVSNIAQATGALDTTLIIAPQFLTGGSRFATGIGDESDVLWWDYSARTGWRRGLDNRNSRRERDGDTYFPRYSSFEVIDHMIRLFDQQEFPMVRSIVVSGFSAGAQFVQRYAVATDIVDARIKFIVGGASTYAYISPERRSPGTRITTGFEVPPACPRGVKKCSERWQGFFRSCDGSIDTYDDWGYGLDNLSSIRYLRSKSKSTMRRDYPRKRVIYMIGDRDQKLSPQEMATDRRKKRCAAYIQGKNRLNQARIYMAYLDQVYPGHRHTLIEVPGVKHNSSRVFGSPAGRLAFFSD